MQKYNKITKRRSVHNISFLLRKMCLFALLTRDFGELSIMGMAENQIPTRTSLSTGSHIIWAGVVPDFACGICCPINWNNCCQ